MRTRLEWRPRMADFALWATACETALWPAGTFTEACESNRKAAPPYRSSPPDFWRWACLVGEGAKATAEVLTAAGSGPAFEFVLPKDAGSGCSSHSAPARTVGSVPVLFHHPDSSPQLTIVAAAQRDDEFVSHLAPSRTMWREPEMRIRRLAPTNQTRLPGHEFAVCLGPKPTRLR